MYCYTDKQQSQYRSKSERRSAAASTSQKSTFSDARVPLDTAPTRCSISDGQTTSTISL